MVSLNPLTLAGVKGHAAHCRARIQKAPVSMKMGTYETDKPDSPPTRDLNTASS